MKTFAVSIPTFNRPQLLRRCLQALVTQCAQCSVDVYVFDDSCSDVNRPIYDEFCQNFPCLHVKFNSTNLGIDNNIDQCITEPAAQYVWVIGEDDLVCAGAIETLMKVLLVSKPDYVFVNYQYISNDYNTLLHVATEEAKSGASPAGRFFAEHGWATGFLGANVVNKARWDALSTDYMGTYFNHVGKIFSQLSPRDEIHVISEPLIFNRAESLDSFTWLNDCFEVNAGFGKMIHVLSGNCPEWAADAQDALVNFQRKIDLRNLKSVMVLRALGAYDSQKYKTYMRTLPLWPLYRLVAVMPVSLMRKLYAGYRAVKLKP